jgi:hypothetical protein
MGTALASPLHAAAKVSEARRARNLELGEFATRLCCECGRAGCRKSFPAAAGSYRGTDERFILAPVHLGAIVTLTDLDECIVVRADDRFFVVELNRRGRAHSTAWSSSTSRPWLKS